jgi:FAD dependent oxidoreductase
MASMRPLSFAFAALVTSVVAYPASHSFDVAIYGGTAGGVIAAVSAAREGLKAAILEPGAHLGGMVSSGLGFTDYGKKEVIGGYALEFYLRAGRHYRLAQYAQKIAWLHEPSVAEAIFNDMAREAGVAVFLHTRLREHGGVAKNGSRIASVIADNGDAFDAKVFIDSSYEGDLMANAGMSYIVGRESAATYGEPLGGVRERTPLHQFLVNISPFDAANRLLPEISSRKLPPPGSADNAVQSYNFRLCLIDAPNRIPFVKPTAYDANRYELLARLIAAREKAEGKIPALGTLMKIDRLPNGKTDVNNNGPFSTDFIGGSQDYPDASYARREAIWQAHKDYTQGLLYFLGNDERVPASLRAEMNRWGLAPDEFNDTANWPRQLYIREARRMIGDFVMTQKDLQTDRTKPDPIGMGSYNSDSHNVERIVGADGFVRNEGDMQVPVEPYQIPYRIMLPKRAEATNLLVPVAFSASHVAYSSVRMEPQYMILGQAAGAAAAMAIAANSSMQDIATDKLAAKLRSQGAIMEYAPSAQDAAIRLFEAR